MAEHRIRRWLQFGIMDLLILTAIVAVVVVLCQPVEARATEAAPWVLGVWEREDGVLLGFHPDGSCGESFSAAGSGWTLRRHKAIQGAFILAYSQQRLLIRGAWNTGEMEVLHDDGNVQHRLKRVWHLEGPIRGSKADGTWRGTRLKNDHLGSSVMYMEYRNGELVDLHRSDGERDLVMLNRLREARKLPPLTERDFPNESTQRKPHE